MTRTIKTLFALLLVSFIGTACSSKSDESGNNSTASSQSTSSSSSTSSQAGEGLVELNTDRLVLNLEEGADSFYATAFSVRFSDPTTVPFVSADHSNASMVDYTSVGPYDSGTQSVEVTVNFIQIGHLATGTYLGNIELTICSDEQCLENGLSVDVILNILPTGEPSNQCHDLAGVIFDDCVDPTWFGPYAWQQDHGSGRHFEYFDNDGRLLLSWSVVPGASPTGEYVIDVEYGSDDARGQLNFAPPEKWLNNTTYDMSLFADGHLEFDVLVRDWGQQPQSLSFAVECGWPCGTDRIELDIPTTNVWQHFTFPVSQLVELGLDLSNVNIGFIIGAHLDTSADGLHFAVDNIRWVGGTEVVNRADPGSLVILPTSTAITTTQDSDVNYIWVFEAYVEGVDTEVYYQLDTQNSSIVAFVDQDPVNDTPNRRRFRVAPTDPQLLEPGSYKEQLSLRACIDMECSQDYAQSPVTLDLVYTIEPYVNSNPECTGELGELFIDCIGPHWLDVSAWETIYTSPSNRAYRTFNGGGSFGSQWQILDLQDGTHNQVIDVIHGEADNITDHIQIVAAGASPRPSTNDLSEYQNGYIQFDVRVLDWGQSANQLNFVVECIYPCRSREFDVTPDSLGEWHSVVIPVAELTASGLDLSSVHVGLNIWPGPDSMAGAHYQIDNIRWVK